MSSVFEPQVSVLHDDVSLSHRLDACFWSMRSIVPALLFCVFLISRIVKVHRDLQAVGNFPGLRVPFSPLFPGLFLPTSWWNPGYFFLARNKMKNYTFGTDTFSVVSFLAGSPCLYTANVEVLRQVAGGSHKTSFFKAEEHSVILTLWGMNLFAADGHVWRKHHRIIAPAFNIDLYQSVWSNTLGTYREMMATEGWNGQNESHIRSVQSLAFRLTVLIIGQCGFGLPFSWSEQPRASDGRTSIPEALKIVGDTWLFATFLPNCIRRLPFRSLQESYEAHGQVSAFVNSLAVQKKAEVLGTPNAKLESDIFTNLVKANESSEGKLRLDHQELIGNIFVMLYAGYDTSANGLSATIALLSVHQEAQEEVYQQILSVCGTDGEPTFQEYERLDRVRAAFYEAVRMYPAVHVLVRTAHEDTVLRIPKSIDEDGFMEVPVSKGAIVVCDMIGIQHNPRYFREPALFKPSQWYGVSSDSDAFTAFSIGQRECIGRKFAAYEAVAFLTSLLRDFSIHPHLNEGETLGQWEARVLKGKLRVAFGVEDFPLRLRRRH